MIEPNQTEGLIAKIEKKKNYHHQQIQYINSRRKTIKNNQPESVSTYRTITNMKSMGKQIVFKKGECPAKNLRRVSTAMAPKNINNSQNIDISEREFTCEF